MNDTLSKSIEVFIRSVPNITKLPPSKQILLIGHYIFHAGNKYFTPTTLKNAFVKARLQCPIAIGTELETLSKGNQAPLLFLRKGKYTLSRHGDEEVKTYIKNTPQVEHSLDILRNLIPKIKGKNQESFLNDAILCAEIGLNRAAIVMTWLLVIDHLEEYILKKKKQNFNVALSQRPNCKLKIKNKDDFSDLRESILIEVMRTAKIINKDAKRILDAKLDIRNTCAHPSDTIIPQSKVIDFVEDLILNIVLKYR